MKKSKSSDQQYEDKIIIPAEYFGDDREYKQNPILSKISADLYDDAKGLVVEKLIEVKRITVGSKGERWKILENSKVVFVVEGQKLLKKEKEFLRSLPGLQFLIKQGKLGIKTFTQLKRALKKEESYARSV